MTTAIILTAVIVAAVGFAVRFGHLLVDDGYGYTTPPRHVH